jgi:hypothetical protein
MIDEHTKQVMEKCIEQVSIAFGLAHRLKELAKKYPKLEKKRIFRKVYRAPLKRLKKKEEKALVAKLNCELILSAFGAAAQINLINNRPILDKQYPSGGALYSIDEMKGEYIGNLVNNKSWPNEK